MANSAKNLVHEIASTRLDISAYRLSRRKQFGRLAVYMMAAGDFAAVAPHLHNETAQAFVYTAGFLVGSAGLLIPGERVLSDSIHIGNQNRHIAELQEQAVAMQPNGMTTP